MSWSAVQPAASATLQAAIVAALTPANPWPTAAAQIATAVDAYVATLLAAATVVGTCSGATLPAAVGAPSAIVAQPVVGVIT